MNRFKPHRAGIIGLWDYDHQVFSFADGRLVLRGANGSGKTKALEVLFPFVLDGRMDPHRLDPFSGEERSMKKNLLFHGQKAGYGYAWMSFVDRQMQVTVGIGMQAREEGTVKPWFFVTDRKIPEEMDLIDAERRPLSRAALLEALGAGSVFDRAVDYRAAIDARLFGLGPERYEAMLDLVLTLRRPQLAKALKLESLSRTLSEGLRPLDESLIRDAAQAFDDLEKVQRELDKLARADRTLRELIGAYRTYLGQQASARGAVWTERERLRDNANYEVEARTRAQGEAIAGLEVAEDRLHGLRDEQGAAASQREVLLQSDAWRAVGMLDELRKRAASEGAAADRMADSVRSETARRDREAKDLASAERAAQAAVHQEARARDAASALAAQAAVIVDWTADPRAWSAVPAARSAEVKAIFGRLEGWEAAKRDEERADAEVERARGKVTAAEAEVRAASDEIDAARAALLERVGVWEVGVADDADRAALIQRIAAEDDERTLKQVAQERFEARLDAHRSAAQSAAADARDAQRRVDDLTAQIAHVRAERDDAPAPLAFRQPRSADRRGAPLWRLVRFVDGLDLHAQIGLEGALEAAGLLDAWLDPDEAATGDAPIDAVLQVRAPLDGPSLADWLRPEGDSAVPAARIDAWLRSVSPATVGIDGRFDLGPMRGLGRPAAPRYIGATARAQHRAQRIVALEADRDVAQGAVDEATTRRRAAEAAQADIGRAIGAVPSLTSLNKARHRLREAEASLRTLAAAVEERRGALGRAQREAAQRYLDLRQAAAEAGLPSVRGELEALRAALDGLLSCLTRVEQRGRERQSAERQREDAANRRQRAEDALGEANRRHAEARSTAMASASALQTAERASGQGAKQVLAALREVDVRLDALKQALADAERAHQQAIRAEGAAREALSGSSQRAEAAQRALVEAEARLRVFATPDLAGILGVVEGEEGFSARLVAAVRSTASSESARKASRTRVDGLLQTLDANLGTEYHPAWNTDDDVLTIEVEDGAARRPVGAFSRFIEAQLAEQRDLLSAREQSLFEDQLLGSLVDQLHDRIGAARRLVRDMDRAMHGRRMSSGHSVGVSWSRDPEAPGADPAILGLLERQAVHLGEAERGRLRRHFSEMVKGARSTGLERPYVQVLAAALDYRRWFRFDLTVMDAQGGRHKLTAQRYAQLSGGEKSASLHMPLFAAAHAHFNSARSTCPRLVALDEAFAGIDDVGTPELIALTVAFDLDLFMTGYDLWVTEPSVPAVAHYDLAHDREAHTVSAWLILWNGRELVEGEGVVA